MGGKSVTGSPHIYIRSDTAPTYPQPRTEQTGACAGGELAGSPAAGAAAARTRLRSRRCDVAVAAAGRLWENSVTPASIKCTYPPPMYKTLAQVTRNTINVLCNPEFVLVVSLLTSYTKPQLTSYFTKSLYKKDNVLFHKSRRPGGGDAK